MWTQLEKQAPEQTGAKADPAAPETAAAPPGSGGGGGME